MHSLSVMPSKINHWLVDNRIFIKDNPAISPDMTLDFPSMMEAVRKDAAAIEACSTIRNFQGLCNSFDYVILWHRSEFCVNGEQFYIVESKTNGDCVLVTAGMQDLPFAGVERAGRSLQLIPLYWGNVIILKNFIQYNDSGSTIFPVASDSLGHASLGIGARFTTLHWPAVAWAMKHLGLSLTANQNSIPRELVYDTDAMLEDRLNEVPFPFIGRGVPEGHQGQSVQGMSVTAVITFLKYGFHKNRIPWGFNADHQPVGGRFDSIEPELVRGSLFASYITYDLSPALAESVKIEGKKKIERKIKKAVGKELFTKITQRLESAGVPIDEAELKRLVTYLMPAMEKMLRRDSLYQRVREENFTTDIGRKFHRELSIDELPGLTTPHTLAVALAMAEALGVRFQFVAPNIGFQKNFPFTDNDELRRRIESLHAIAEKFGVSIGFHSGSGKSEQNYRLCGEVTKGRFEVKTSGRYTYEMGVALSQSPDSADRHLFRDWFEFTKKIACKGAFADDRTQRDMAREFITQALRREKMPVEGVFDSPASLKAALDLLAPSPDHMFWFEYNFLFILAAQGECGRLGDHGVEGYAQRGRFYKITDNAKLVYARRVVEYITFLAHSTGMVSLETAEKTKAVHAIYRSYNEFLKDIAG